jgi:DNA-binding Lrp family transcriptional regulator
LTSSKYICKPKDKVDTVGLKIIKCLSRDCRASYREISSIVGLTPNTIKERINTMVCNGIIQSFIVYVNPVLFGYEKDCILTVKHMHKKKTTAISEDDIIKQLNLLGDVRVYAKQLQGSAIFVISLRPGAEYKIELIVDLLKQSDIAKETSLSTKTITRRLEKLREDSVLQFSVTTNMSSMQLIGYIEFAVIVHLQDDSLYQQVLERIYQEMQEYLFAIPHANQKEGIFLVFFCPNIPTVDLILRSLESCEGVDGTEMFITTKLAYYQEWVRRETDRRLKSEEEVRLYQQPLATQ